MQMSPEIIGLLGLGALLVLVLIRIPVAVSLIAVSFVGTWIIAGNRVAMGMIGVIPYGIASQWELSSIPSFILMGYIAYHGKVTAGLFSAARVWLNGIPGGLAIAGIFGATGFAAVTGSSVACSASMGRIAVPEMLKSGYDVGLATGSIAAAGTIGALIPPSILLIIFGIIANVSITDLFVAGVVPGLLTGVGYIAVVVLTAILKPNMAPRRPEAYTWADRFSSLRSILPTIMIILTVFGGLFAGVFTPTAAGAVGSVIVLVLCLVTRTISLKGIWDSFCETLDVCATLFIIVIGASMLVRFLAFSGAGAMLSEAIVSISGNQYTLLLGITLVYLFLGMFLDPMGSMLLTLPIFLPVLHAMNFNLVWFGVLLVKYLEIGMITPPVGLNVFVMKGVVGDAVSVGRIFKGVAPFILADLVLVIVLIAFPSLVLFLPNLLN